jgi:hypothetical protein
MAGTVQIDKIMMEVNALDENGRMVLFRKIEELLINSGKDAGDDVSVDSVFGLWKDRDITLEKIRQKAWRKN